MTWSDITAIGAILLAIWANYSAYHNKKHSQPLDDYKSALEIAQSASDTVKNMRIEVNELKLQICEIRRKEALKDKMIEAWTIGIRRLIAQIIKADMVPCWEPTEIVDDVL